MSYSYFAINKTNKTYAIRNYPRNNDTSFRIIGKLYPNELCVCNTEDGAYVNFLSSRGQLEDGLLVDGGVSELSYVRDYPYSIENIKDRRGNFIRCYVYQMRRSMPVYRTNGTRWGTVAGGMFVASDSCSPGDSHIDWMKVNFVKSTKGNWVQVDENGEKYGFVDTGLSKASAGNQIALHGNW